MEDSKSNEELCVLKFIMIVIDNRFVILFFDGWVAAPILLFLTKLWWIRIWPRRLFLYSMGCDGGLCTLRSMKFGFNFI